MLRNKKGFTLAGLVVVLIVVLAIGFGIYRMFFTTRPLKIKDLEDMYIVTTRSSMETGWAITADYEKSEDVFGQVADSSNEYYDGIAAESLQRVCIMADQDRDLEYDEVNIQSGDRIELTYDGGQRLLVYLPKIIHQDLTLQEWGLPGFKLYVASDGSTYYDEKLTQLAQSTP